MKLKALIAFCIFFALFLKLHSNELTQSQLKHSVVKVHATVNFYDFASPWNAPFQSAGVASGVVIGNNKILTVAHAVDNPSLLTVQLSNESKKYPAKVVALNPECDLAILEVVDESFSEKSEPLSIGNDIENGKPITVLGYPIGGGELCLTKGVVSRSGVIRYSNGNSAFLATQIDAAINQGSSGGPVVSSDNKVVGIVFQGFDSQNSTGYMIPLAIIKHFLKDHQDGLPSRIPTLNVHFQIMESPSIREFYHLKPHQTGMLVTLIHESSCALNALEIGDILLFIDGIPIENDGMVILNGERVFSSHLLNMKRFGEAVKLGVLRNGKILNFSVKLTDLEEDDTSVPCLSRAIKPSYYIYGGLVFQPLTQNYLFHIWGNQWPFSAPLHLTSSYLDKKKKFSNRELVILSRVLPDQINQGYQGFTTFIVDKVNDELVQNFQHFVFLLKNTNDKFIKILTTEGSSIFLNKLECEKVNDQILSNYNIEKASSQ